MLLVGAVASACGSTSSPTTEAQLRLVGHPAPSEVRIPSAGPGRQVVIGQMLLCADDRPGTRITKVTATPSVGSIQVEQFAVRPNPFMSGGTMLGDDYGTLTSHHIAPIHEVAQPCSRHEGDELIIQVANRANTESSSRDVVVHYGPSNGGHTVTYPLTIDLCPQRSTSAEGCQPASGLA